MKKIRAPKRKVKKVIDGDTFKVSRKISGNNIIRLARVNAPEKRSKGGRKATNTLRGLIGGKKVSIKPVARDKYGRIVAEITQNRRKINKRMKEKGY